MEQVLDIKDNQAALTFDKDQGTMTIENKQI